MKKNMTKMYLLAVTTLLTSVSFASQETVLSEDVVNVANLIKSKTVLNCISKLEKSKKAELSISSIVMKDYENEKAYVISGTLLVGGDVAVGDAVVEVVSSVQPFLGRVYECK